MSDIYRKETISFRFVGLSDDLLPLLQASLNGIELRVKRREGIKESVVVFDLDESRDYSVLSAFIHDQHIPSTQYGLWISLVTDTDNGGVHVPDYAIQLIRRVGGQLDFSFVSV